MAVQGRGKYRQRKAVTEFTIESNERLKTHKKFEQHRVEPVFCGEVASGMKFASLSSYHANNNRRHKEKQHCSRK